MLGEVPRRRIGMPASEVGQALLVLTSVILPCYFAAYLFAGNVTLEWANRLLPGLLLGSLTITGYRLVRADAYMIWSPLPWFLGAAAAYYGVGPLIYHWGSAASIAYADAYYQVTESSLWRTNVLNAIGITVTLLGYSVAAMTLVRRQEGTSADLDWTLAKRAVLMLVLIGGVTKYLIAVPYSFGLLDFTPPGSLLQLKHLSALAIVVLLLGVAKGQRRWRLPLIALISLELATAILEFSKLSVLVVLIMIVLGWYLADSRPRVLIFGSAVLALTYLALTPLIPFGRDQIVLASGTQFRAGFGERLRITRRYIQSGLQFGSASSSGYQDWWIRLNYANAQAFAMESRDGGHGGNSFALAAYALVPRILWPEKPEIAVGRQFTYLVTGDRATATAPGVFAEAYWNGGWLLVVVTALLVGGIFGGFTRYSLLKMRKLEVGFLPVIFMGIQMGFRLDDWFALTYVAPLAIAVILHLFLKPFFRTPQEQTQKQFAADSSVVPRQG